MTGPTFEHLKASVRGALARSRAGVWTEADVDRIARFIWRRRHLLGARS